MTRREETRRDMVRAGGVLELAWKLLGDCLEIASKLLTTLMLDDRSGWISHGVHAMMGKTQMTLVISGSTMHEGFHYRAICTMEL